MIEHVHLPTCLIKCSPPHTMYVHLLLPQVNVSMPAQQLQRVTNLGLGDIILNPGFNTTTTAIVARGTGRVFARGINTNDLQVVTGG